MAKSKNRRKAYNPTKHLTRSLRKKAEKCVLYRWEESNNAVTDFNSAGPYSDQVSQELMQWALAQNTVWLVTAVACFVTPEGDYYEEFASIPPVGPVMFSKNHGLIHELRPGLIQKAKEDGNHKHYVNAVFSLQLHTRENEANYENDAWLKQQAVYRSRMIHRTLEGVSS